MTPHHFLSSSSTSITSSSLPITTTKCHVKYIQPLPLSTTSPPLPIHPLPKLVRGQRCLPLKTLARAQTGAWCTFFFLSNLLYIYLGTLLPVLSRMPRLAVLQLTLPHTFPALYLPPQPLTHSFRAEQALEASGIGVVPPRQCCSTGVTHLPKISTTSHLCCLDLTKNEPIEDHESKDHKDEAHANEAHENEENEDKDDEANVNEAHENKDNEANVNSWCHHCCHWHGHHCPWCCHGLD